MQQADIATFYDQIPYPRLAYHYTHPDRMAVLGRLFGMRPQAVESCRVLELGCAAGANLIPLAHTTPQAEFVGIDLSSKQIAEARSFAGALELTNVRLEQLDLRELDASFGVFDYIIAHGLYSWIPEEVREQVLRVCSNLLAPQGIAYVSYNAYPGCHLRKMLRGMAMYHVSNTDDPREVVTRVRGLVDFLAEMTRPANSPYALVLRDLKQTVAQMSDSGLIHELLENDHHPLLFHDFIRAAEAAGLQYLTEATFADRAELNAASGLLEPIRREQGEIGGEQYLDFLSGQSFRRTLLCRRELPLERDVSAEHVNDFLIASSALSTASPADLVGDATVRFTTLHGVATAANRPAFKIALAILAESYPTAIPFPRLCQFITERMPRTLSDEEVAALRGELLGRFMMEKEVVEFRLSQATMISMGTPRPLASAVARYQAERGWPMVSLTHKMAPPADAQMMAVLSQLDGEHSWEQLGERLADFLSAGAAPLPRESHSKALRTMLSHFGRHGLLVR
jgi:methyltransferase-like protein/ubiquinone/menaquinone biosynthesis C-methylase UbiE